MLSTKMTALYNVLFAVDIERYHITAKTELGATDFTFTAPTNLVYNGEQKTATVSCANQKRGCRMKATALCNDCE